MYEEMSKCKDLFSKYGGHKMAAGLSLPREHVLPFMERIEESCRLTPDELTEKVHIDMQMPFGYVNEGLLTQFSLLEPFGNGNRRPLFAQRNVELLGSRILGKNENVGRYTVRDEQNMCYEMISFGDQKELLAYWEEKGKINVTYYPELHTFRGRTEIRFVLQNYS